MRFYTILLTLLCLSGTIRSQALERPAIDSVAVSTADPRLSRGLSSMNTQFVPKGQWIAGLSASYSTHKNDSYSFLIVDDIDSEGYTFKVTPLVAYAIRDNMAIGGKFIYSRTMFRVNNADMEIMDTSLSVDYYYALQHTYSFGLIWRQYIPLGTSKRFALFNEAQLAFGGGQAEFAMNYPIEGTYQTNFNFSLGISPGFVAFATNNLAFEVNVGLMGITYNRTRQVHNRVAVSKRSSSMMNFKVNVFSIGLGMSFYL